MKAFASKSLALAGMVLAGVTASVQPALAYAPVGVVAAGPGTIDFTMVSPITCTGTLAITVAAGGTATVTGATFTLPGSAVCPFITITGPWTVGAATLVSPNVYQATISNITLTIRQTNGTLVATCTGNVPARLDQNFTPHRLTFAGNLITTAPVPGRPCPFRTWQNTYLPTNLTAP